MRDVLNYNMGDRKVTVDRHKLLTQLKENKAKHAEEYRLALDGYKDTALEKLNEQMAATLRKLEHNKELLELSISKFDPDEPPSDRVVLIQQIFFDLRVPVDHTRSYDVAIKMAEWEVGETIELTQAQFQCFVLDDWEWKEDFVAVSKSYNKMLK